MIPTTHGLIYSPKHYDFYVKDGDGAGLWVSGDIAKWNMVWLSMPLLDLYLTDMTHKEILAEFDHTLFGSTMALAHRDMVQYYPGLRSALLKDPAHFLQIVDSLNLLDAPAGKVGGAAWLETVKRRAMGVGRGEGLPPLPTQSAVMEVEQAACDNVIRYDFAGRKRMK